jgi:hypothetical protein
MFFDFFLIEYLRCLAKGKSENNFRNNGSG